MSSSNSNETFSIQDLLYLKVAIAIVQSNLELRTDMPETYDAMEGLKEKVERLIYTMSEDSRKRSVWYN